MQIPLDVREGMQKVYTSLYVGRPYQVERKSERQCHTHVSGKPVSPVSEETSDLDLDDIRLHFKDKLSSNMFLFDSSAGISVLLIKDPNA